MELSDGMNVEEIQNQVELSLMAERYFTVAKSYMLYRQKHTEDRETRDRLQFLINYCNAENAATGSKYDANANVDKKNIATLIGELPKSSFIRLNRRMLTDRLKELYGKELSDKYLSLLNNHFIYKNDETSLANYCASITMYPWLLNGTAAIGGNSKAPTNLKSFNLSGCPNRCKECHTPELTDEPGEVCRLSLIIKAKSCDKLKTGWYSGKQDLPEGFPPETFDYIKLGPYIEHLGGLTSPRTNQRFYRVENGKMKDQTALFRKNE